MRCITFYLLACSLLFTTFCKAQHSFTRNDNLTILSINGDTLKNPWAGGFNAVQFSEIDLNLDGINDLFVFDRTGNRISTFINSGEANQITYTHDPSYIQYFPTGLHDWVLLRDYNCDGKMDIFMIPNLCARRKLNIIEKALVLKLRRKYAGKAH